MLSEFDGECFEASKWQNPFGSKVVELHASTERRKKYYYRDEGTSPLPPPQQQRLTTTLAATTPTARKKAETKVAVVYYISRNGHLEQPHFMEVPLSSSSDGLHIRDVIAQLNVLRGRGLADMYSWSSKRNYKSGYVWQDLSEDDFIQPCNDGQEYVLKGSELPQLCPSRSIRSHDAAPSTGQIARNCSSTYEVIRNSTNMSTQTDDKRIRKGEGSLAQPPGTSSSNEGLEGVIVKVGYNHNTNNNHGSDVRNQGLEGERPSGRMKATSSALIHLIMCGPKDVDVVDAIDNVRV